jgi:hypothetical protein
MRRLLLLAVCTATLALGLGATASADVAWLCHPGMSESDDPCRGSLETTIEERDGSRRTERPRRASEPIADCFYVYPTVSEQPTRNADKRRDAQLEAIARYQAARFSQTCRVFTPIYRQQTLAGLAAFGQSPEAYAIAYSDVREAWRRYLITHNRGRPVLLLAHSQGTWMLRRLVREEIDREAPLRRRLLSAILLGGQVTVARGRDAGGDFRNVPACRRPRQTGCVIAFSTYNEPPPEDSRFGRPPPRDASGFGLPTGPAYEILCTNPASLAQNDRTPTVTLTRTEPYPGVLGAALLQTYGGPPPTAPTPWIRPGDRYSARCETHEGANVLMVDEIGDSRRLNPSPEESWGLHLVDMNIALGDLVDVVDRQASVYAQRRPQPPRARVSVSARRLRGCAVRVTVGGRDRDRVARLTVRRGERTLARNSRRAVTIPARRVGRRPVTLRTSVVLRDGRRRAVARSAGTCPPRPAPRFTG